MVWSRASCGTATWQSYPSTPAAPRILLDFRARILFYPIFEGQFWRSSGTQNGSCRHIVGKLSTSSFQRYKVCANRSSDEGVMAPGSRGVGAVFVHFSDEDSGQTGDAIGEPRVPRRSRSHYLSNAPGLADQLVASRKDSAREGGWVVSSIQFLVWSTVRSNLGQTWSTLVKLGRIWSKLSKLLEMYPGLHFKGFWARWVLVGLETARSNLGQTLVNPSQTWSTLVKLGQTLGNVSRTFFLGVFDVARCRRIMLARNVGQRINDSIFARSDFLGFRAFSYGCRVVRLGLRASPSGSEMGIPRFGEDRSGCEKMVHGSKWTPIDDQFSPIRPTGLALFSLGIQGWFGLGDHPSLKPGTNRGRIGLGDHPGLETKFVIRVRIGLGDHPGLETETNRGRIGLGSRNEICDSGTNRPWVTTQVSKRRRIGDESALGDLPRSRNGDESGTNRPWGPPRSRNEICDSGTNRLGDHPGLETETNRGRIGLGCLIRGSGSGGHRRSDRLAKGKAVIYAPESSPDTDDEYDAMEDVRTRFDASIARNLQAELDAEAAGPASSAARPPPRPGVVIGRSARPSETTRPSPQPRSTGIPPSRLKRQRTGGIPDSAGTIPEDYVAPGFRYPPQGGIRPRYPVTVEISDTPLLTNLLAHPSSLVRRCQEPPESVGRGGWSEFSRLLAASRPEYREFLTELGFGPFLGIPYVSVYHPAVWCFIERFFHHTGTFHLSTCEMAVLPVDWSAILGIRFGGRAPPSEPVDGFEAREILGLADREIERSLPTELRYRQWAAYFIFSCFLGNDRSTVPTPIVGMFRDIDALREYDWGTLTYGFYIRGLRRYSRRESISFLGFWQFTVFWAFEHFPTFAPSRLPDAEIVFQPYSGALTQRPEVFRAVELSHLRLWIRTPRSWELLLGERTLRQLGDEAVVPVDPSPLMTIEDYIPRAPSDPYVAGVEGGRVMGGVAMDSHLLRSSGQIERLEGEILRLQLELSVSVDRHAADMDRAQEETARVQAELTQAQGEMAQMQTALTQSQRDLGAGPSGFGQTSSPPPTDPVTRDWFFDDPPST
uniref:Aminotransferase-like plant mobile domain-containing protein n=1 Tax=Fagus sylvatica TaxID=28930 RepID=A0A2N9IGM1_FAGSY